MSEIGKIKWLVGYLILLLLIFGAHSYYLYFEYIPANLAPYVDLPEIHAHVQKALYSVAGHIRLWFLVLEGSIIGHIVGLYIAAKKKQK